MMGVKWVRNVALYIECYNSKGKSSTFMPLAVAVIEIPQAEEQKKVPHSLLV